MSVETIRSRNGKKTTNPEWTANEICCSIKKQQQQQQLENKRGEKKDLFRLCVCVRVFHSFIYLFEYNQKKQKISPD